MHEQNDSVFIKSDFEKIERSVLTDIAKNHTPLDRSQINYVKLYRQPPKSIDKVSLPLLQEHRRKYAEICLEDLALTGCTPQIMVVDDFEPDTQEREMEQVLSREEVYDIINSECDYQDQRWINEYSINHEGNDERTINDYCLYIKSCADDLARIAEHESDHHKKLTLIRKVGALCVNAMKHNGGSYRLMTTPES